MPGENVQVVAAAFAAYQRGEEKRLYALASP